MARHGFPMARGGGQDLPRAGTRPTAKASRHGARAKEFAPRRNTLLGESLPTQRTSERICPRENAPLGEGFPTRRTGERICPAQERSPRRKPPDTAHGRKDLPHAGTLSSAKASRHSARAKGFAPRRNALLGKGLPTRRASERICPRENAPLGEGLSTRRTSERICPARERSPRRRPPDTAHERKDLPAREGSPRRRPPDTARRRRDLPRARRLSSAKASRHGARAKGFARARTLPSAKASRHGARAKGFAPRGSRSPHVPTNGGTPSVDGQPEKHPFGGVAPTARAATAEFIHLKK